ncbi:MAG: DUF190 domain-containing protein [Nitrospiraceae bacterium]|nr:DUF190 domain-containing protein [Nitrospiraceae bacterium]
MRQEKRKKITVYLDETTKHEGRPAYEAVLDLCSRVHASGASVFRGIAGYGSSGVLHRAKLIDLSATMPVKIEVIDTEEKIMSMLDEICIIAAKGLVEVTDAVVVCRS